MPASEQQWKNIANEFWEKWQFPLCIGALDGKHVNIKCPNNSGSTYYNYKHTYSIVLMALVDADYKFIYIDVGCKGRISDGGVFKGCTLKESLQEKTAMLPGPSVLPGTNHVMSYHMLADDAFPLCDEIMKPYQYRNLSVEQLVFNYRLSRARRIVENAFGILASRFCLFLNTIPLQPDNVESTVMAACALHNFLRKNGDTAYINNNFIDTENPITHEVALGSWREDGSLRSTGIPHNQNAAQQHKLKRDILKQYFCSDVGEVDWQYDMI